MAFKNFHSDAVREDEPLRLAVAAACAFPDGSMTASGLRREAARGRLSIERIAGKDYTTLSAIKAMREECRSKAKVPDCGSNPRTVVNLRSGLFATENSSEALDSVRRKLKKLSGL